MKFRYKIFFLNFFLIFFYNIKIFGQKNIFLSINEHYGYILPHHKYFYYFTEGSVKAFEIQGGIKTKGDEFWHKLYKFPDLGFSFYYSSLNNNDILGKTFALYSFINSSFTNNKTVNLTYNVGSGIEYSTEKFDIDTNIYNTAIGSNFNVFIKLGFGIDINISDKFSIKPELFLTHFSDGAIMKPNKGINLFSFKTGVAYYFNKFEEDKNIEPEKFAKQNYIILFSGGMHKNTMHDTKGMFVGDLTFDYIYRPFYKSAFGLGIDIFYDSAKKKYIDLYHTDFFNGNTVYPDIHAAYYLYFGNTVFIFQVGPYIYYKPGINKNLFSRFGLRYNFSKSIIANLSLKTYLGTADFIELGIGYNFFKK